MLSEDESTSSTNRTEKQNIELHYYVFKNDLHALKDYIQKHTGNVDALSLTDNHGNTPLHLACMLGRHEMVKKLLEAGAIVKKRNKQMWTPLNEAISYGNRDTIKVTLDKFEKEVDKIMDEAKPKIVQALDEMIDFYVEIKWDFESWIPLVSRFLPSDLCKLYKKGTKLRLDCTLGDLSGGGKSGESSGASSSPFSWQRGDLSFMFDLGRIGHSNSVVFMDNGRKLFVNIEKDANVIHDLDKEVDLFLSREMVFLKLNTHSANFAPSLTGWFSKKERFEAVCGYWCQFYDVSNLVLMSKLRSEHLTDEEIKRNDELRQKLKKSLHSNANAATAKSASNNVSTNYETLNAESGNQSELAHAEDLDELDFNIEYKPSLEPPPDAHVDWNDYLSAPDGDWPSIGRLHRIKESKREFKAQIAMSQEFPLTLADLNKLLDALVPLAKFRKLKDFLNAKLPPGFPVKIEMPVVPTISAKVCFMNFKKNIQLSDELFQVPSDYVEDKVKIFSDSNNDKN